MSYGGEFALNYNINDLSQLTSFVTVFDPDNNAVLTQNNMSFTVLPGKTGSINFTLNSDKLGIWTARYSVSTKDGKVLISSSSSFAVSKLKENPEGFAYSWSDLTFSMTSDQETYEYGSKALFTFHLWNKGSEDKNVTANWGYASKWIVVPAKGYTSFNYTLSSVLYSGRLKARFYVDGIEVGYSEKGFWMVYPYVKTHIETDSRIYMRGETVSITLNLENSQAIAHNLQASVQVKHTSGTKLCESSFNISMPADSAENRTFSFVLPSDLTFGTYNVVSEINEGVNQIAYDATYFEVP